MHLRNLILFTTVASSLSLDVQHPQHPLMPEVEVSIEDSLGDVRKALESAHIIPTVISDFTPQALLSISWRKDAAKLGNTLPKVKYAKKAPVIFLATTPEHSAEVANVVAEKENKSILASIPPHNLVLAMTDPDARSRKNPDWSEMCHWLVRGITYSSSCSHCVEAQSPPCCQKACSRSKMEELVAYNPPGPPPKTGKHRYVYLVFAPANGTSERLDFTIPNGRKHWGTGKVRHGVRDWAEENGMAPVAGNFVYAKNKKQ